MVSVQELVVGVVCPRGDEAVGIGERGLEVAAGEIEPGERNIGAICEHGGDSTGGDIVADGGLPLRRDGGSVPCRAHG